MSRTEPGRWRSGSTAVFLAAKTSWRCGSALDLALPSSHPRRYHSRTFLSQSNRACQSRSTASKMEAGQFDDAPDQGQRLESPAATAIEGCPGRGHDNITAATTPRDLRPAPSLVRRRGIRRRSCRLPHTGRRRGRRRLRRWLRRSRRCRLGAGPRRLHQAVQSLSSACQRHQRFHIHTFCHDIQVGRSSNERNATPRHEQTSSTASFSLICFRLHLFRRSRRCCRCSRPVHLSKPHRIADGVSLQVRISRACR